MRHAALPFAAARHACDANDFFVKQNIRRQVHHGFLWDTVIKIDGISTNVPSRRGLHFDAPHVGVNNLLLFVHREAKGSGTKGT